MNHKPCANCGASVPGLICDYCGTLNQTALDYATEREALNEFHNILQKQSEPIQVKMLTNGFLPDHPTALIEAGMRVIPLVNLNRPADKVAVAAVARLRGVLAKTRLLPADSQRDSALAQFEKTLAEHQEADRRLGRAVIIVAIILLFVCLGLVWLLATNF